MPTTPQQSWESGGVRPPRRTAAVTGVPFANSGHCSAIPGPVATLWEPATPCADVPGTAPATVLPTPGTFLCCRTLNRYGRNPRLQDPRDAYTSGMEDGTLYRRHHDAHWSHKDAGAISARLRTTPRTTVTPGALLSSATQCIFYSTHPLHTPDLGRRRRLLTPSVHVLRPSLCL